MTKQQDDGHNVAVIPTGKIGNVFVLATWLVDFMGCNIQRQTQSACLWGDVNEIRLGYVDHR